jgi:hypothetical protein
MDASVPVPAPRALVATLAVAAAIAVVVFGGFVVGGALSRTQGEAVDVAGVVRVHPLSGWEIAGRSQEPPRVRLTRGGGNLDVVAVSFGGSAADLASEYVRSVLEPEAQQLSMSRETLSVTLTSGLQGVRLTYVGLFGKAQVPIEGEVTAVVSPSGVGVVFDGWGAKGVLRFVVEDVHAMIETAEIS